MWPDDNYKHMKLFQSFSVYDKNDPRTELVIFPIFETEYEFDFVVDYVSKYIAKLERQYEVIE